jgi:hypothetical protein
MVPNNGVDYANHAIITTRTRVKAKKNIGPVSLTVIWNVRGYILGQRRASPTVEGEIASDKTTSTDGEPLQKPFLPQSVYSKGIPGLDFILLRLTAPCPEQPLI